ncbi:MAG TPA: Fic family protein [Gemmatimonadaceae bacterium]|jgi:Fic family protein|nr:Fic family protein [Gemmatimonadaceae bacterium]
MHRGPTGSYRLISSIGGERVRAFLPKPLPPAPPLQFDVALEERIHEALVALGRLDTITLLLPDSGHFLYSYVRKEAVLSSQIEGTQSTLSDLLLFEAEELPGVPIDDVTEVSGYVAALEHGLARLKGGFPLSNRLIRDMHGILLARGRGSEKDPGSFRRTQNWLGGSRPGNAQYVPPPASDVPECMSALEKWLHDRPERTPPLLKAALAHVQFESIHPFLDGNGRVGRLLVTLILHVEGVLQQPLLYLSLYLKQHRDEYYELLDRVRREGDWEAWIGFFADGVRETAMQSVDTVRRLNAVFEEDAELIRRLGRASASALRVHAVLEKRLVSSANGLASLTGLSLPTVYTVLEGLATLGIVRELTGRERRRVFSYQRYLAVLSEGTEVTR